MMLHKHVTLLHSRAQPLQHMCRRVSHVMRVPGNRVAGHDKAVAYVRWLDTGEVVSASTDSTLRLWDLTSQVRL